MKLLKPFTRVGLLSASLFMVSNLNAQSLKGSQADLKLKGASEIRLDAKTQNIAFVKLNEEANINPAEAAKWLKVNMLGSAEAADEFKLYKKESDKLGFTHYRYQQYYKGVPVEDAIYIVHSKNERIVSANGVVCKNIKAGVHAKLSKQQVFQKALAYVHAEKYAWQDARYNMPEPSQAEELLILNTKAGYKLVYKIDIYAIQPLKRVYLYIDAQNGTILKELNRIETVDALGKAATKYSGIQKITTDSVSPTSFFLRETGRGNGVGTYNMMNGTNRAAAINFTNTSNFWNNSQDNAAYDAHFGAEATYDFYMSSFSRNSYDNNGGVMNNYVHYSNGYVNAFWDGVEMTYGDGDGITTGPLTSLDVIGHELTHGYTQHSANLGSLPESGALNESFSDIFGNTIRQYAKQNANMDWRIGDELLINGTRGVPFRDMSNPKHYSQPDTYQGDFWDFATQEVHHNNGVQNFWYYLLVTGGTGVNDIGVAYAVKGIGLTDAIQIVYRSENFYLTSSAGYVEARDGAINAAIDLFGACSNQVIQTTNAWYAVGMGARDTDAVTAGFVANNTYSCSAPATIQFTNTAANALTYKWDFGDGDTAMRANPAHTYLSTGTYTVKLVVTGTAATCGNNADSLVLNNYIHVTNNGSLIAPACAPATQSACCKYGITGVIFNTINNKSADGSEGYKDFSCSNSTEITAGNLYVLNVATASQSANTQNVAAWIDYNNDGIFSTSEKIMDTNQVYQNNTSAVVIIPGNAMLNTPLRMRIGGDSKALDGCSAPLHGQYEDYAVTIRPNTSIPVAIYNNFGACNGEVFFSTASVLYAPTSWFWDFGDGTTSSSINPSHTYTASGAYNVKFKICNSSGCDSISKSISVALNAGPIAATCRPTTYDGSAYGIGIKNFTFNTLHNTNTAVGYQDHACMMSTDLVAGVSYPLTITVGSSQMENVAGWIDYNNDGAFDASELIFSSTKSFTGKLVPTVIIPSHPKVLNTSLRLRIADGYLNVPAPDGCVVADYGQYEDYAVVIQPRDTTGIKNYAQVEKDFFIFPNPAQHHLNIVSVGMSNGDIQIEINDMMGRQVYTNRLPITRNAVEFDLNLPDGIYAVQITNATTHEHVVKKLVIQQ